MRTDRRRQLVPRRAFTLVEVLVVATLILLIAGILLVVVRKVLALIHSLLGPGLLM